jgi:tetratricopeptide (TPR) repeat protein
MKITQLTLIAALVSSFGCTAANSLTSGMSSTTTAMTTKLGETGRVVKGQFSTMGTAVGSAYSKSKTMVTGAFAAPMKGDPNDPVTLTDKPPVVGPELHVAAAANYEFANNFEKAAESYKRALEIEPNNMAAILGAARLASRQKNYDQAIEMYAKAEAVNPKDLSIYAEWSKACVDKGDLVQAKAQLQKAVNMEPSNKTYRQKLASVLLDQGQPTEALQEMQQVETPAMANYQMAYLYASRKNIPVAQQYLQTALTIDPNLQPARDLMGSLQNSRFAQQAYGSYQQANQAYQGVSNLYQQAGQVYQQAGQVYQQTASNMTAAVPTSATMPAMTSTSPAPSQSIVR